MAFNYGLRPTTVQMLASSGTSSQSSAFGDYSYYVRVCADADCHILFGSNPVAVAQMLLILRLKNELSLIQMGFPMNKAK